MSDSAGQRLLPVDILTDRLHECGPACRDGLHCLLTYALPHMDADDLLAEAPVVYWGLPIEVVRYAPATECPPYETTAVAKRRGDTYPGVGWLMYCRLLNGAHP